MCIEGLCGCFPWESLTVLSCYTTICNNVCVREFYLLFLGGFKRLCVFIPAKRVKRDRKSSVIKFQLQLQVFISHFEQTLSHARTRTHTQSHPKHIYSSDFKGIKKCQNLKTCRR